MNFNPDKPYVLQDEIVAELAKSVGVLDQLTHESPGLPEYTQHYIVVGLPFHYALICYIRGGDDPGFSACLLPRSKFSVEKASATFEEAVRRVNDGKFTVLGLTSINVPKNN